MILSINKLCFTIITVVSKHCFTIITIITIISKVLRSQVNPLTPMSDEDRISPNRINTISSRQVVRIKKYINLGIISRSNTKILWTNIKTNCMVDSKENYKFDLGVTELNVLYKYGVTVFQLINSSFFIALLKK